MAAGRTVAAAQPHSLHLYFVRGGRHGVPVTWSVTRVRDGLQLHAAPRRGGAVRRDHPDCDGELHHQARRARAPGPHAGRPRRPTASTTGRTCACARSGPTRYAGRTARSRCATATRRGGAPCRAPRAPAGLDAAAHAAAYDDPLLHAAVLVYGTDRGLLGTAGRPHGLVMGMRSARASTTRCGSTVRAASTTGCCTT